MATKRLKQPIRWDRLEDGQGRQLRCRKCGSSAIRVTSEPVERKRRTVTAHEVRPLAECQKCEARKTIHYGAPVS